METKLCDAFFGGGRKAAPRYRELIRGFSEADYRAKKSDELAKIVMAGVRAGIVESTARDPGQQTKTISGKVFEFLVAEMILMHGIAPLYAQVEMWKVPASKMDFLLYDENAPVVFTCKLSLGERWRQAAFEGMFLKNIYPKGKCYLVSGKQADVDKRKADIARGEIGGIDGCYMADSADLKKLLVELSRRNFSEPQAVHPIKKSTAVQKRD